MSRPSGSSTVTPPTCWCHDGVSIARNTASVPVKRFMCGFPGGCGHQTRTPSLRTMPPRQTSSDGGGPRRRLDRTQVLVAAEAIVDEHGWDELTMARLAAALGIKVPSLYNHVPSLD